MDITNVFPLISRFNNKSFKSINQENNQECILKLEILILQPLLLIKHKLIHITKLSILQFYCYQSHKHINIHTYQMISDMDL